MEEDHTPIYLLLQQYSENLLPNLYMLNFIACKPDLPPPSFHDAIILTCVLTYEIELPPYGKKLFLIYWMTNILQSLI